MREREKNFGGDIRMSSYIEDDKLPEKYSKIWDEVRNSTKKEINSGPVDSEKYLRAKTKSYEGKLKMIFHNDKIPKEDSDCICL